MMAVSDSRIGHGLNNNTPYEHHKRYWSLLLFFMFILAAKKCLLDYVIYLML